MCALRIFSREIIRTRSLLQKTTCQTDLLMNKSNIPVNAHRTLSTVNYDADNKIWKSPYPNIAIPDNVPFVHYLLQEFKQYGDQVAMIDAVNDKHSYTYNELIDAVTKVASALTKQGMKKGDVCVIYSPNIPEYPIIYMAVAAIGGIVSAANPVYTSEELLYQLDHSGATMLVTVPMFADKAREAAKNYGKIKQMIVFGESEGFQPFSQLMDDDRSAYTENIEIDTNNDLLALPYSSGTTGLPKGVMLSHYNIISNIEQLRQPYMMGYDNETFLGVLPFFHIYGQVVVLFTGLICGSKIVTMPKFDPQVYLNSIEKHRATMLHIIPPLVLFLTQSPEVHDIDISTVNDVFCAAAPLGKTLAEDFTVKMKCDRLRQGYGLTETSPVTHCNPKENWVISSIGVPVPNTDAKIVDVETGEKLGPNQDGELCVRGPQVMKGYLKNKEATDKTIIDGWLHTGDIARFADDGHTYIVDRLKELIKYKGFQVAPAELEDLLVKHPSIADAAVIGIPDERAGELPRAYVVLNPGQDMDPDEVASYIEQKVAPTKKLRGGVEIVSEIPKSASGKILRRFLKANYLNKV
ncbi:unnamed protein product [Owenia fusiformis]|uniref:Luciferin 4-monooxygenase n=1 Tax=Owenia fusiformis TaxID=6347 RepID=A0A8S4NQE1_OWEFU|nr:unnamed protein product [Owenia fusiformis]